jgi:hypothetical protein
MKILKKSGFKNYFDKIMAEIYEEPTSDHVEKSFENFVNRKLS